MNKKRNNKNNKGGKVLASGGFGCVFEPALKCEGTRKREKDKISKLMSERHALQEYQEITKLKNDLETIPDYKNFFLVNDVNICKPGKLTKTDLVNFKKCTALPKDGINKDNINDSLDKLRLINIPYGGFPVDDYIFKDGSFQKLFEINTSLMKLLVEGIIPMNEINIYHSDIKDSNVLIKEGSGGLETRLIDWGLSTKYIPFENNSFPRTWRNRPLQYNVPFSIILFTDDFFEKYKKYSLEGGDNDPDNLRPFVVDYIHFWLKKRGTGHLRFINDIMNILFSKEITSLSGEERDRIIENDFTMTYITNYLISVLENFTRFRDDGNLNLREYLDKVFIKIIDIWGFISIYFPILDFLFDNYDRLNGDQMEIYNHLKNMYIKYLYSPRIEPIDITELLDDLRSLNYMFDQQIDSSSARGLKMNKLTKYISRRKKINSKKINSQSRKKYSIKRKQSLVFKSPRRKTKKMWMFGKNTK